MRPFLTKVYGRTHNPFPFINGYYLLSKIDQGNRAEVFLGVSTGGELKAIKCYTKEIPEKFDLEDKIKENHLVDHNVPNVVKIEEVGRVWAENKEVNYSVMEYLEGVTLKDYISERKYNSRFISKVVNTLYATTQQLFEINIVHRDIKPANIMVTPDGGIVLIDLDFISKYNALKLTKEEQEDLLAKMHAAAPYNHVLRKDARMQWRVMNLHCIGNVLNDMIVTKKNITPLDIWLYLRWGLKILNASGMKYSYLMGRYVTATLMTLKMVRRWFLGLKVYG